jgi:hypothetical protein
VAVGEVVGDLRHRLHAHPARREVAEDVHRLRRGADRVDHVVALLLLREVLLRGRGRRDERHLGIADVVVDRERLEGRQRPDDHVHVVLLDELLRLRLRLRRRSRRVREEDLDLAPGDGVVALLEEQVDAVLHLLAARGERAGAHGEEAEADGLLRGGERRDHEDEGDRGEASERGGGHGDPRVAAGVRRGATDSMRREPARQPFRPPVRSYSPYILAIPR